jgi:hypothetical protein
MRERAKAARHEANELASNSCDPQRHRSRVLPYHYFEPPNEVLVESSTYFTAAGRENARHP